MSWKIPEKGERTMEEWLEEVCRKLSWIALWLFLLVVSK